MATGDILSAVIKATGREIEIKIEGLGIGGVYDLGLGINNDPTNAKIKINLTEPGFDNTGAVTTVQRVIYATSEYRKPYPDQAENQEAVSGSDVIITVPLSEYVGVDASLLTVDVLADFYTDSIGNNAITGLVVTNNSTAEYGKVVANWGTEAHNQIVDSLQLKCTAFHRSATGGVIVQAVKFTVTDESLNTITKIITVPTATIEAKNSICVIEYLCNFNSTELSALTAEETISCDFKAYPIVGNASSILDTSDGVNTSADWRYKTQENYYDPLEAYEKTYAVVDAVNGSDTTGAVADSLAVAELNPYLTIAEAMRRIRIFNSAYSRNNASNGYIYLKAGTYPFVGGYAYNTTDSLEKVWLNILPYPGEDKTTVFGTESSDLDYAQMFPRFIKIRDIDFSRSATRWFFWSISAGSSALFLDDCKIDCTGADYSNWQAEFDEIIIKGSDFAINSLDTIDASLFRGNNVTGAGKYGYASNIIGNYFLCNEENTSHKISESTTTTNTADGAIIAFNKFMGQNASVISIQNNVMAHGMAIVQNVIERAVPGPSLDTAIDIFASETDPVGSTNVIKWCNTVAGQRENMGYNNTGAVAINHTNWSEKGNLSLYRAYKADLFSPQDGARIGSWGVGFQVGSISNLIQNATFTVEFDGINSILKDSVVWDYAEDASITGTGLGDGDYHLGASSEALGLFVGDSRPLPYDIDGVARIDDGAAGAYEYVASEANYIASIMIHLNRMMS